MNENSSLSIGCDREAARTGVFRRTTHDGRKRQRSYLVDVPHSYSPSRPMAVVIGFHGNGGKGEDAMGLGVVDAGHPEGNAIFVAPDGIEFEKYGVGWDDTCAGYDMPFFDNIVADLADDYCIDTKAVSAYGFSWGGDFALALACCRGNRLKSIAIHAASDEFVDPSKPETYWNLKNGKCPAPGPAPTRFTHAEGADEHYPAPLFDTTSRLLRSVNGCGAETEAPSGKACYRHQDCAATLEECSYKGLGHRTPPGWGQETWNFLKEPEKDRMGAN